MRETVYDLPYVNSIDDIIDKYGCITKFEADMPNQEWKPDAWPTFKVKFNDGTVLESSDIFELIRKVNAYLKYALNDDIVKVIEN